MRIGPVDRFQNPARSSWSDECGEYGDAHSPIHIQWDAGGCPLKEDTVFGELNDAATKVCEGCGFELSTGADGWSAKGPRHTTPRHATSRHTTHSHPYVLPFTDTPLTAWHSTSSNVNSPAHDRTQPAKYSPSKMRSRCRNTVGEPASGVYRNQSSVVFFQTTVGGNSCNADRDPPLALLPLSSSPTPCSCPDSKA
jgi:hypothetical protein